VTGDDAVSIVPLNILGTAADTRVLWKGLCAGDTGALVKLNCRRFVVRVSGTFAGARLVIDSTGRAGLLAIPEPTDDFGIVVKFDGRRIRPRVVDGTSGTLLKVVVVAVADVKPQRVSASARREEKEQAYG
jgi:hypothetical protein